jgi:hypothetical protein
MLEKTANFFWRIAGWKTFVAGVLIYLVFGGYVMPNGAKHFSELSGKEVQVMDLQFSYTPEKARSIIGDYSEDAKNYAINFGLIADTIYPIAYTFLFIIIMAWIFKSLAVYGFNFRFIHLFPLSILLADYAENLNLVRLFRNFPDITDAQIQMASAFTTLKWSLLILQVVIVFAGIGLLVYKRTTAKKSS